MISGFNIAFINILLCTFFSFITAPIIKRIGEKFNIVDIPDSRKVHTYPIVRIGGLSIFATFFLYYLLLKNFFELNIIFSGSTINLYSIFCRNYYSHKKIHLHLLHQYIFSFYLFSFFHRAAS